MEYTILFNSGLSFEDTISVKVIASSKEEALELAISKNLELSNFYNFIKS
jgi:hypothetical protein